MFNINKIISVLFINCFNNIMWWRRKKESTQTSESKIAEFYLTGNDEMKFNLKKYGCKRRRFGKN